MLINKTRRTEELVEFVETEMPSTTYLYNGEWIYFTEDIYRDIKEQTDLPIYQMDCQVVSARD